MSPGQSSVITTLSDQLRRDISLGELPPGTRLNIESLKRGFKVSHPSVREALSLLVGEGYVESEDQKGFRVTDATAEGYRDLMRVRAELECLALDWSVRNADTDWRASVVAAHYALTEAEARMITDPAGSAPEWDERNRKFHNALLANCGSPRLLGLICTQYDLSRGYRLTAHRSDIGADSRSAWLEKSAREHVQLKDAALAGDAATGMRVLREHITRTLSAEVAGYCPPASQRA